jgi:hypothetical protein
LERHLFIDPDKPVVRFGDDGRDGLVLPMRWGDLRKWMDAQKDQYHYIGAKERPGVRAWANLLETRYFFPPCSPRNDLFTLHGCVWEDVAWIIVSIPQRMHRFAVRCADQSGLVIVDKLPVVLDARLAAVDLRRAMLTARPFPVARKDMWTLEYKKDTGAAVNKVGARLAKRLEDIWIDVNTANAIRAKDEN